MSKLSQLKQKAYQAGKNRDWDLAISVYEQILELEKSNPTIINELGDLCLKSGNSRKAIKHFLSASSKYRKTGLLNNSVAICKKILRHDESNMHAHWYLAEIRSSQDLLVEGEGHALAFLAGGDQMGSEIQEIFLKRCGKLLELYPGSLGIMERLIQVFRTWEKPLEASRAGSLRACVIYDEGDKDGATALMEEIVVLSPEIKNYPEFGKWNKRINPEAVSSAPMADYNSVTLGESEGSDQTESVSPAAPAAEVMPAAPAASETPAAAETPAAEEKPFAGVTIEIPDDILEDSVETVDKDEDGCLVIDMDGDSDMEDLIAEATREADGEVETSMDLSSTGELELPLDDAPTPDIPEVPDEAPESVDLLAQILSEDSDAVLGDESSQLDTIAAEIGSVVGGDDTHDDADRLYEMGMVYLEMGLFDKACESFKTAAKDDDFTLRAHEMWGITLQRAGRPDESITVLTAGLQFAEANSRENLGLRYHIGRAHEMAERPETAAGIYEEIQEVAPNFLDISSRLTQLSGV